MLKGDLKDHDIRLYLGMPMYGGMLGENTLHGVLGLQAWTTAHGVGMKLQSMGNESLITRARNTIASMFLDDQNFVGTHLLFIDADIGFQPENIERLIRANKDIACGIYPRKCIHWNQVIDAVKKKPDITEEELSYRSLGYNLNFADPKKIQLIGGFCEVMEAATGMMLIKRDVFLKMQKAYPERQYKSDQIINGGGYKSDNCYDLFGVGKIDWDKDERYLSEDYYFSRLWSKIGGKIWADVAAPLVHQGNMHFKGHVGTIFSVADDLNKNTTQTGDTKTDK
jgi:glycosyltransferase involved in cell wall biosynthesis